RLLRTRAVLRLTGLRPDGAHVAVDGVGQRRGAAIEHLDVHDVREQQRVAVVTRVVAVVIHREAVARGRGTVERDTHAIEADRRAAGVAASLNHRATRVGHRVGAARSEADRIVAARPGREIRYAGTLDRSRAG